MKIPFLAIPLVVLMLATALFTSGCSTISPPIKSIIAQDINGLRKELDAGVSPDYVEPMDSSYHGLPGHSLVTASLWAGRADMVDLLFRRGADPHKAAMIAFPRLNKTPYRDGNEFWVTTLINHGVDPNEKLAGGRTPLHFSCNLPGSIEFLVRKGARIDEPASSPDVGGGTETPLGACLNEINAAQDTIKMLLASKYASVPGLADADTLIRDNIVKSALMLLKLGADPSAVIVRGSNKVPLIIKAYTIAQPGIARALLDHGADVMARTEPTGESVLHVLAKIGAANDVLDVIARAKIAARSKTNNPREANELLFSWLDQLSVEGKAAMHLAGSNGRMDVIQALIENGADASLRDRNGRTTQQLVTEKIERDRAAELAAREDDRRRLEKANDDARESAANRQGMLAILGSVAIAKGMSGRNYTDDQRRTVIDSYVSDRVNAANGATTDNFEQSVNTVKRDMDLAFLSTQTRARIMEDAQELSAKKANSSKKRSTTSRVETASVQPKTPSAVAMRSGQICGVGKRCEAGNGYTQWCAGPDNGNPLCISECRMSSGVVYHDTNLPTNVAYIPSGNDCRPGCTVPNPCD